GVADAAPGREAPHPRDVMPRLTNEMVARIQGWGAPGYEWEFLGRKTSVYRQIGNAFPPPVAAALGESLVDALQRSSDGVSVTPPATVHDPVYRALRAAESPLTIEQLSTVTV